MEAILYTQHDQLCRGHIEGMGMRVGSYHQLKGTGVKGSVHSAEF